MVRVRVELGAAFYSGAEELGFAPSAGNGRSGLAQLRRSRGQLGVGLGTEHTRLAAAERGEHCRWPGRRLWPTVQRCLMVNGGASGARR